MSISDLSSNKPAFIKSIRFEDKRKRQRFLDLGFTYGTQIEVLKSVYTTTDPLIVKIRESRLAIRLEDANNIEVEYREVFNNERS